MKLTINVASVNEQAVLKTYKDRLYAANREYDYEDDWDDQDS